MIPSLITNDPIKYLYLRKKINHSSILKLYQVTQRVIKHLPPLQIIFVFIIFLLISCNISDSAGQSKIPEELQPLYREALEIHDEVMPRMGELTLLQEKMTAKLDELRSAEPIDKEALRESNRILGQLNRSESAMWDWMHSFSTLDSIPGSEKEVFLTRSKSSAEDMKNLILSSLETARKYLQEHPIENPVVQ